MAIRRRIELIFEDLGALSGGYSFCMDRRYGWNLASEGAYRERIVHHFQHEPELSRLLPCVAKKIAANALLADTEEAYLEVKRCLKKLKE